MNREDIKEQLTNKARDLAQNSVTKKNYVEIVRNDEFLDLLDKLMKQSPNVVKKAQKPIKAKYKPVEELTTKIPFAPIAFEHYEPVRLGEYVETKTELHDVLEIAQQKEIPNILIEAGKGTGKTTLAYELASVLKETYGKCNIIAISCSSGLREGDLRGRYQLSVDENGKEISVFVAGVLIEAIQSALRDGIAVLYLDELNALEPELQKMLNSLLDARRCLSANGHMFRVGDARLIVVATQNPSTYSGVQELNEDLRSRFVGDIWDYPAQEHLEQIVDWTDVPEDVKQGIMQLATDTYNYRTKGDVEYVLTVRDLKDFCEIYRIFDDQATSLEVLRKALDKTVLIRYSDATERELIQQSINDTFDWSEN